MSANVNAQVICNVIDRVISGRVMGVAHSFVPHTRSLFSGELSSSRRRSALLRSERLERTCGTLPTCRPVAVEAAYRADGMCAAVPASAGRLQTGESLGRRGDLKRRDMRRTAKHAWRAQRAACSAVFASGNLR